jgi:hypothetical protein
VGPARCEPGRGGVTAARLWLTLAGRRARALSLRWSRLAWRQDSVKVLAATVRRCVDGGHG